MRLLHYSPMQPISLGNSGNTVGYAIFNTSCVVTAIVSGIITKEWVKASGKARSFLYLGLTCMVDRYCHCCLCQWFSGWINHSKIYLKAHHSYDALIVF